MKHLSYYCAPWQAQPYIASVSLAGAGFGGNQSVAGRLLAPVPLFGKTDGPL